MAQRCQTCAHPDRERIELELATARSVEEVAKHWDIHVRSLSRHRQNHMEQAQIARLRHSIPDHIEIDIDELTRRGGEDAMIGFKRLNLELQEIASKFDKTFPDVAIKARGLQFKVYCEQLKLAARYPGKKSVTNNNLVIADGAALFKLVDKVLGAAPDVATARKMLAAEYRGLALENAA